MSETFQAERATFQDELARIDPSRTKVVDESRVEVGMRLPYGYSLRGTRCTDIAPYRTAQYCARTKQKLIGWLSLDGSGVVARCVRTVTGCLFRGFVRQHLACHLCPGDVVVWDNARIHGVEGI